MSAGTLTLTNNSAAVAGNGTAFTTEVAAGDFIVVTVGGVPYTLPIKSVESGTALTLVSNYTGPTQSGAAWSAVPREVLNMVTAAMVVQNTEALRGLNYDKQNWQQLFSGTGTITVRLPDNSTYTGPAWGDITSTLNSKADKTSLGTAAAKNVGSNSGDVVTSGSTQPFYKTTLPSVAYNDLGDYGYRATVSSSPDSVAKMLTILASTSSWTLGASTGIYNSIDNNPENAAHLLMMTDGGGYLRRWWLYNNGTLVGPTGKFYSEANTTKAADGTLKAASPVIRLFADGRAETNAESEGCTVTRLSVGEYLINGCTGLNADAGWGGTDGGFDVPTDRNKQPLIWLDYEVNADGSVLVKTYHRTHPDAPVFARNERDGYASGDPIDIPSDQFVSVRVEMPVDSIWHQKQRDEREAMEKAERERQQNQQQEQL
ncbi:phage tail protein [Citrobacter portucalensis]|uniref:phage tail fiber protein n=1 Tax=Citrobacter portucalensis TaxID=1639133 RepID=UPI00292A6A4C|nr:phage tail protein [Citrobacter portucalensis]MDV0583419.1 phage tail protein [Citrobacter portucalensis]MEB0660232.1 phage tail protein [Citrobacter portucalensis]MEB0700209.1 phage tail protein [Citrobacter portucalensis]